jgi:mannose-6-phosphate isomerase-like protein (cupin superfamily)
MTRVTEHHKYQGQQHGTTRKADEVNDELEDRSKPTHEQGTTHILDLADPERGDDPGEFQGCSHGAGVSLIVVDAPPGGGPKLHRHPYEEVFVVQEGTATFTAGEETIEVSGGQVVVVPAGVAHRFVNSGAGRLRQVDVHASDRFVTEWLED